MYNYLVFYREPTEDVEAPPHSFPIQAENRDKAAEMFKAAMPDAVLVHIRHGK